MNKMEYIKQLISHIINTQFDFESVSDLVKIYKEGLEIEKEIIRAEIAERKCGLKILSMSETLSEFAYNENKDEYLEMALFLQSIEDFNLDPRENIIYLSIIWYVAQHLKVDEAKLFNCVIGISSNKTARYLQEFYDRSPQMKSIKTMGLKATVKDRKVTFEMNTPAW